MSILSGYAIELARLQGQIRISDFNTDQLNSNSYDLRLGTQVKVYDAWVGETTLATAANQDGRHLERREHGELDIRAQPRTLDFTIVPERGWLLKPRILYLMHTEEVVWTDRFVPVIDGKSSIGRLGIKVHETAGFGDVGFDGQYTLEVTVQHAVRVFPGYPFCQIRFHTVEGKVRKYRGNYRGKHATGPVASRAWRQFT